MPNWCYFEMKLVGKKENRDRFIRKLSSYDEPNHFWRTDVCGVREEGDETYLAGNAAWSVESCCRSSGYSQGVDLFSVNTKDLGLKMEVYSNETGMCFEEHFLYDNGECLEEECVDMNEYWWDRGECSFEEFKEDNDLPENLTESDLDDNDNYKAGGFESWDWHI